MLESVGEIKMLSIIVLEVSVILVGRVIGAAFGEHQEYQEN